MRSVVQPSTPPEFAPFLAIGQGVSSLFFPHVEVVLHDLRTDRIVAIWNSFSKRRPGDASLLGDIADQLGDDPVFGPYEKASPSGATLKSVTSVVFAPEGDKIGLFCINFDVSIIESSVKSLKNLLDIPHKRPAVLFRADFREDINLAIRDYLETRSLALGALKRRDRIDLIAVLAGKGLFETRHAADHVAGALGLSRATIYGLLAAARSQPV